MLEEAPGSYAAHQNLSVWYATRRPPDLERARAQLREAIRVAGDTPWGFTAQLDLATTYEINASGLLRGPGADLEEAGRRYLELIRSHPQRPEPHLALAALLEHQGRTAEALEHHQRALEIVSAAPGAAGEAGRAP